MKLHAIQALPVVSRLSQLDNCKRVSAKPTEFRVTLRCYVGSEYGGWGKQSDSPQTAQCCQWMIVDSH